MEAALVLPILILALSLIISYASDSYEKIKEQIESHNLLRGASMDGETINKGECDFVRNLDFLLEEI